ncbi:thermonuclease family protein [uncultured Helicobacter sp.]|uniref:thermonuclease family protein n=1 Tax=uncultured Helicobacter sp. TaxID=175537 RepID=UPI0037520DC2
MKKYLKTNQIAVIVAICLSLVVFLLDKYDVADIHTHKIQGKIIKVYDGDTITLYANHTKYKIRLYGIDAPELNQNFGKQSQENLQSMCEIGNEAIVEIKNKDRYNRLVGILSCDGINANKKQLESGYAWAYTEYISNIQEKLEYNSLQKKAKDLKLGLWSEKNPIKPSEFRHNKPKIQTLPAFNF